MRLLAAILVVLAAPVVLPACNPCERKALMAPFSSGVVTECEVNEDCRAGHVCLACGVCVLPDECGSLAGSCDEDSDCGDSVCDSTCGCVAG